MKKKLLKLIWLITPWRKDSNAKCYLNGIFFFLLNYFYFKKIGFPLIKYKRVRILHKHRITFGKSVTLGYNCFISPISLIVGNHTRIGINNVICGVVQLGTDVHLGPNVVLPGASHNLSNEPLSKSGSSFKGTIIEDYVWVGSNVTIVDGVKIGKGAVIAANSIVTKDVESYTVVGGVPAKFLKNRPKIIENV